jgi:hypothetical protein
MNNKYRSLIFSVVAIASLSTLAEETPPTQQAISIPNVYIASDSEGFSTYKYKAGYIPV